MSLSADQANEVLQQAECCYTKNDVEIAIDKMANAITADLGKLNPLLLCVMNGGLIITGDLLLRLDFPLHYDYIHATRYAGEVNGSTLVWVAKPQHIVKDRHILIIDDILDEGITLREIVKYCNDSGAASVKTAVLVNKQHNRKQFDHADYVGLSVDDRYVFGYGMDYKGYLRNVPGIYAVKET